MAPIAHFDESKIVLDSTFTRDLCLVGGAWIGADSGAVLDVTDPATGAIIGRVPDLSAAETIRAVDAATAALPDWAGRPAAERARILRRFFDLMIGHQEALATILTAEQGKPIAEARGEIAYAAAFMEWFGEEAKRVYGDIIPSNLPGRRLFVQKQPVGVVAAITPWNFPAAMITRKIGPALAAGCTIVVKPAAETPLSALALGVIGELAGLPAGVLNIVTGDPKAIGGVLTNDPRVRKLSFTGSTRTGRLLLEQCAASVKKTSMELGGNAPFLVFDDADVDAAVEGTIASKFRNAGQTCVCTNRIYAQAGIYDLFVEKLAAAAACLKMGHGLTAGSVIGPLITEKAVQKVEEHLADAVAGGATVLTGGSRDDNANLFFPPTVVRDVTPDMLVCREETFGPLAAVVKFETEEEAVALANESEFGLAGYFYSRDLARAWRVAEALECGMVGVNTGLLSTEVAPFGGVKQSGLGREGSRYGIEDYIETKYICMA